MVGKSKASVLGSARPTLDCRRLRRSTAISESRPRSWKPCRTSRPSAASTPSTRATCSRTWARTRAALRCGASSSIWRRRSGRFATARAGPSGAPAAGASSAKRDGAPPAANGARNFDHSIPSTANCVASGAASARSSAASPWSGAMRFTPPAAQRCRSRLSTVAAMPTPDHGPQLMAEAGQAQGPAVVGQAVEERVGGGVVPLPGRAQQRRGRREQDEEVERHRRVSAMQVPGAQDLRREHLGESGPVLLLEDAVARGRPPRGRRPRGEASPGDDPASAATSASRATSAWTTRTSAPCSVEDGKGRAASAVGPRRPVSTRCRAPRSTIHCARRRPRPPRPPVIR